MARRKLLAFAAAGTLLLAACGGDDSSDSTEAPSTEAPSTEAPSTEAPSTEAPSTEAPSTEAPMDENVFEVNVDDCEDPDAATAAIEGDVKIGTSMPLSGGPAVLFAPLKDGIEAYYSYFNETNGGVNGQQLVPIIKDDQYTANLTVTAVEEMINNDDVALFSEIIGSPNNAAVQEDLNAQCIPQLWAATGAPNWGAVDTYPWTSGLLVAYAVESQAWLEYAATQFPDGGTAGMFYVNNEFGQAYADAFKRLAGDYGFDIVAEEKIEASESGAPSGQMTNLVAASPDIILAVPLGAQCIAFMTELGNAKAANADFQPLVYQTATCANPVFFGAADQAGANGVYTSSNLKDVNNPDLQANDPDVQAYLEAFASTGSDADPGGIAVAGWVGAELTAYVIQQAYDTCGIISRECIINAVRNIDYAPSLAREGLTFHMDATDGFIAEGTQIIQWDSAAAVFVDVGDIINLEGSQGVYTP